MGGPLILHATSVAFDGRALLILGPSGSGKSALALNLMAFGAGLIADDRTILTREGDSLCAACPGPLEGLIEARGLGILRAQPHPPCPVRAIVDLSMTETERFPPARTITLLDLGLPVLHKVDSPHFPAALRLYMEGGRYRP